MITITDLSAFLTRRRGRERADWTDIVAYTYLLLGVLIVLLPVLWMVLSSIKSQRALVENDPRILPYDQVDGDVARRRAAARRICPLARPDGTRSDVALVAPRGRNALVYDLTKPDATFEAPRERLTRKDVVKPRFENYTEPTLGSTQTRTFNFLRYFWNSTFVTVSRNADHAADQRDGRVRAVEIQVQRPRRDRADHRRDAADPADGDPRAAVPDRAGVRHVQLAVGRHHPRRRDADRRVPAASVHADDPRRVAGGRPHGRRVGVAASSGGSCCRCRCRPWPCWRSCR